MYFNQRNVNKIELNWIEDLQEDKEYYERTSDIRLEELGLKHFDKKRRIYRDLDAVLLPLEDLHQAKEYHERASDKRLKKLEMLEMWIREPW